jgi:hypothetical protein
MKATIAKVPRHYFVPGPWEVWAPRAEYAFGRMTGRKTLQLIASGLSRKSAEKFNWEGKEIRKKVE